MKILRFLFESASIIVSALAGNWIGGQIRSEQTGRPVDTLVTKFFVGEKRYSNFPSLTRFYPAVLCAAIARPRWLWALAAGVLTGWLVDERYEQALLSRVFASLESE